MLPAEKTYCISVVDDYVYLSESPERFIDIVDTVYLNTWLVTKEELDTLEGYLAITYPNVTIEAQFGSTAFLKCVDVPKQVGI